MKNIQRLLGTLLLCVAAGCATKQNLVIDQPVGPGRAAAGNGGTQGELIVYSAVGVSDPTDSYHPTHTGYRIYTPDGRLFRVVDNRTGSFYQDPETVPLPAGKYKIQAQAVNVGQVSLPVVIASGEVTTVRLDVSGRRAVYGGSDTNAWVRLPNGRVIGARAE